MNTFKIALVNPMDKSVPEEYFAPCENLALAYLTAYLRKKGFAVEIIDGDAEKLSNRKVIARIVASGASCIGITSLARTIDDALKIAAAVKKKAPHLHICLGGQHATYAAEDILRENNFVDSVIRGEGEETMAEMADHLSRAKTLDAVEGVYYRDPSGNIQKNNDRRVLKDLDHIPYPARDVLEMLIKKGHNPVLSVLSSRGCYGTCNFCNASSFSRLGGGDPWRGRTAENVVDELEMLCKKYDAGSVNRVIHFYDDNFIGPGAMGRARAQKIAEEIQRRKLNIIFYIFCRADSFVSNPEVLVALKKAGLITAFVGIESSRQSELNLFQKGTSPDQNIATLALMKQHNITMPASGFIMFHAYSNYEDLRANAQFLRSVGQSSFWNLSVKMIVYKGTRIVDRLRVDDLLGEMTAHGGIFTYRFVNPKIEQLADAMNFSTEAVMLKADAVVRYIQFMKNYLLQKLPEADCAETGLFTVDEKIADIFDLSYHFFINALDMSENGWHEPSFRKMKKNFLSEIDSHIDGLNGRFAACLENISGRLDADERKECSLGV